MFIFLDVNILQEILPDVTHKLISTGYFSNTRHRLGLSTQFNKWPNCFAHTPRDAGNFAHFQNIKYRWCCILLPYVHVLEYVCIILAICFLHDNLIVPAHSCWTGCPQNVPSVTLLVHYLILSIKTGMCPHMTHCPNHVLGEN